MSNSNNPLIIGFVADLMFTVQIQTTLEKLGYRVEWVEEATRFGPMAEGPTKPGEVLRGRDGAFTDYITRQQPVLLLFDLHNLAIPWQYWISLIKTSPATRRIPILCFGSHVDTEALKTAKAVGADEVVARSRFFAAMPELVQKQARQWDVAGIAAACQQPLSDHARTGLHLFNQGEYFEAHEALEHAWNEDTSPARECYRAILQIAVAYLQIQRGNYNGAVKMFLRVRQWLDPLPDTCHGLDLAQLRADAQVVETTLLTLGKERLNEFDSALFKPIRLG
ncbi:MAG: DUF309 domain-containing protein [Chloroflexi bacterium]|nr:DUF309 domain-containing protein [Chloroflexota bacterium]MBP8056058.1 DUF309 domain-containing protein [Chloroflexota bacterium]